MPRMGYAEGVFHRDTMLATRQPVYQAYEISGFRRTLVVGTQCGNAHASPGRPSWKDPSPLPPQVKAG